MLAVLLVTAGVTATTSMTTRHNAAATPPTGLSGVYRGGGRLDLNGSFGTWRGAATTTALDFVSGATWTTISSPTWLADQWKGSGKRLILSVPMLPSTGGSMATAAAGGYNAYWRTLANTLISRGLQNTVVRPGWEMNGKWYSWSAVPSPANYVNYFRQIVQTMRAVAGQQFLFDWAPNNGPGTWGFNVESAYPGDAYVDVIGTSVYDQSWAYSASQATERWNEMVNTTYGLAWHVRFAAAHGKPSSYDEWGLSRRTDGHGGNDNPYYIQQMYNWMKAYPTFSEHYFEYDQSAAELHAMTTGTFPNAAAMYKKLWGGITTAPTAATLSTATNLILTSANANRSSAVNLAGSTVAGSVYVFVNPSIAASKVSFYIDDATRSKTPYHVESWAMFDMVGGGATATPYDASKLALGSHTLTVAIQASNGTVTVNTATFKR
ncbi:MAG: glycosyl hydrolase [Mycobacteriales bacterium]